MRGGARKITPHAFPGPVNSFHDDRGQLDRRIGSHDIYKPVVLSRVYVLLDREACQIKIGYTENSVGARKRSHERLRGHTLELLGTLTGGYDLERALHGRFRKYRVEGNEWYSSEIIGELAPLLEEAA